MFYRKIPAFILLLIVFPALLRADLSIMPMGDSITFGAHTSTAGYRYPLLVSLVKAGISFHYEGQSNENCLSLPYPSQWHHNGVPGASIKDIADNLDGNIQGPGMFPNLGGFWMTAGKAGGQPVNPDLIILLIGTNNIIHDPAHGGTDLAAMKTQYTSLASWLLRNRPNTRLLTGTILPITRLPAAQNETVIAFNQWLKTYIPTLGPKVHLVDLYSLFLKPDGSINSSLLADGVHPSQAGYDIMGEAWSRSIQDLIANGSLKKETPAPYGPSFVLPAGNQSPIPRFGGVTLTPPAITPGAAITLSSSLVAGNNALTNSVVTMAVKDSANHEIPLTGSTSPLTIPALKPHESSPFKITAPLPQALQPGTYFFSIESNAPEGSAINRFAAKIIITK